MLLRVKYKNKSGEIISDEIHAGYIQEVYDKMQTLYNINQKDILSIDIITI